MKFRTVALVALVSLFALTGGVAAAPGWGGGNGSTDDGTQGPPEELPGPVPDFVGDIHDAVSKFVNGTLDSLGDTVSGIAAGDGAGGDGAANESGNASA